MDLIQKKKFKDNVRASAAKNAQRTQNHNLYFSSFKIDTEILPVGKSLEITAHFFKEKFLPTISGCCYKKDLKFREFCLFLSNLYYASKTKPLLVNLNKNFYTKSITLSHFILDLKKFFEENHYIQVKHGCYNKDGGGFVTRVWPTNKLETEIFCHPELSTGFHVESIKKMIILRDTAGKEMDIDPNEYPYKLEENLKNINIANQQHSIVLQIGKHKPQLLMTDLHVVFNGSMNFGGRFYTRKKVGYQALYKEDRNEITIDGLKTVERDFTGLHPYLLYASVGLQYKGDPYTLVNPDDALRPVLKMAILILLNCKSESEMIRAGNYQLFLNHNHFLLMKKHNLTIKGLLEDFKKTHYPIAHYFCTGKGLSMMNLDSKIALKVLLFFAERGDACVCVHDSFVVAEKNSSLLKDTMEKIYQEVTTDVFPGTGPFYCPVK